MRRVILGGDDLDGFTSPGFDDHVKLFFPDGQRPESRDFTPRRYDPARHELTIDFSLHGSGPASTWAAAARSGTPLGVGGPRGSQIVSDTFDWNLLVGDDTALPAIARRLEELPPHVKALVVVEVENASERIPLAHQSGEIHWVHRTGETPAVDRAVADLALPTGEGFAWVAGEASMARRIRTHLIESRGLDKAWIKAAAYWRIGTVGKHEVLAD